MGLWKEPPGQPARRSAPGNQKTGGEAGLGLEAHLGEVIAHGRGQPQQPESRLHHPGGKAGARPHDPPHAQGQLDHLPGVAAALGRIALQQPRAGLSAGDHGQLPGQVVGIAQAGVHALAREGRRQVRGVAGQQNPALPPARGHPRMEGIHGGADDGGVHVGPMGGQQAAHRFRPQQRSLAFMGMQHELETPRAIGARQGDAGTPGVAEDFGMAGVVG